MKKILAVGLVGLSLQAFAADSVDYSYCKDTFAPDLSGGYGGGYGSAPKKGFPFKLGDDGKVTPHKDVKYKFDKKTNTETMSFSATPGFGGKQEIIVKRSKDGHISQVISNSSFEGAKTKSGLGSKKGGFPGYPGGGGGMYGGPGIGGGGFGVGGYGMGGSSKFSIVYDVKIKSGKCFPYRSVNLSEMGNNTHKSFGSDVQLCRDLKDFYKKQEDAGSKLNKLKTCHDSYQKEAQKVIDAHKTRNSDLYEPKDEQDESNPWSTGGHYGDMGSGEFASGQGGGQGGYGYPGGFGGSIDTIVEGSMFNSAEKAKQLSVFCSFPYGPMKDMVKDDSLFTKEAKAGGEGSGSSKSGSKEK